MLWFGWWWFDVVYGFDIEIVYLRVILVVVCRQESRDKIL